MCSICQGWIVGDEPWQATQEKKGPRPRRQGGTASTKMPGLDMPVYVVEGEA